MDHGDGVGDGVDLDDGFDGDAGGGEGGAFRR
jgi:hypothetical protein